MEILIEDGDSQEDVSAVKGHHTTKARTARPTSGSDRPDYKPTECHKHTPALTGVRVKM